MYNEKVVTEIEGCISNLEHLGGIYSFKKIDKTPIVAMVESLKEVKDKYTAGKITSIEAVVVTEFVTDVTKRLITDAETTFKATQTLH